jgi:hypothetical protein
VVGAVLVNPGLAIETVTIEHDDDYLLAQVEGLARMQCVVGEHEAGAELDEVDVGGRRLARKAKTRSHRPQAPGEKPQHTVVRERLFMTRANPSLRQVPSLS